MNFTIFGFRSSGAEYFSNEKDFMITPKIGLGDIGAFNVYYGYNFTTNSYPFSEIGRQQLSIVFNIPIV